MSYASVEDRIRTNNAMFGTPLCWVTPKLCELCYDTAVIGFRLDTQPGGKCLRTPDSERCNRQLQLATIVDVETLTTVTD